MGSVGATTTGGGGVGAVEGVVVVWDSLWVKNLLKVVDWLGACPVSWVIMVVVVEGGADFVVDASMVTGVADDDCGSGGGGGGKG